MEEKRVTIVKVKVKRNPMPIQFPFPSELQFKAIISPVPTENPEVVQIPLIPHKASKLPVRVIDLIREFIEDSIRIIDPKGREYRAIVSHASIEKGELLTKEEAVNPKLVYFCDLCEEHFSSQEQVFLHALAHKKVPSAYLIQILKELAKE